MGLSNVRQPKMPCRVVFSLRSSYAEGEAVTRVRLSLGCKIGRGADARGYETTGSASHTILCHKDRIDVLGPIHLHLRRSLHDPKEGQA